MTTLSRLLKTTLLVFLCSSLLLARESQPSLKLQTAYTKLGIVRPGDDFEMTMIFRLQGHSQGAVVPAAGSDGSPAVQVESDPELKTVVTGTFVAPDKLYMVTLEGHAADAAAVGTHHVQVKLNYQGATTADLVTSEYSVPLKISKPGAKARQPGEHAR